MHSPRRKSPPSESPFAVAKLAGSYIRKGGHRPVALVVVIIFVFALVMNSEDIKSVAVEYSLSRFKARGYDLARGSNDSTVQRQPRKKRDEKSAGSVVSVPESCDLSDGEWVFDDVNYPLYREDQCQFLSEQLSCLKNGRREAMYQKWRWQPKGCSLPKFDARLLLERLRGKRMMFVGDSMNRNQWESLVCLLQTALPPEGWSRRVDGSRSIFTVEDYDASIEFYWAPFLVESNSDDPEIHSIAVRIINADSIEKHAVHWKGADVLVFDTYIWWMNTPKIKVLRPGAKNWTEHDEIVRREAYERVLRTVSNWVDQNLDPNRSSVFFMSMSPLHSRSSYWGNPDGIKCAKETMPIKNMTGVRLGMDKNLFAVAKNVTGSTARVPITFIDITTMSEFRKDAHTSVYTVRQGELLTPEQQAKPAEFADCIHWCVPGLPDTWNQILYARLLSARPRQ
ncbi:hypothetical protein OPV22_007362 [Ensete ventricosum]|uniref:Trichome birefringence-like N-terminal domain-containing protein n=1 Tax=Ensete ventricosum TaxID=4639 RepID=A0AAV8RTF8_ENSVE|nr:hypothetical protein OPV22_007362 [Ensete ventricosum]